jgi:serine/threonine protein kinase
MDVPDIPSEKVLVSRLGRYEVRAKIAEGGMAMVYVGRSADTEPGLVALKLIRREYARDMQFVAMFLDEAKITARLNHPNIVKIYEQASHDGQLFIAMELLFGQSLSLVWEASTRRGPRLTPDVVAFIGARAADALHHAHELKDDAGVPQQVIHRDINPSNIFVTYGGQVKIVDFGLAKAVDRLTSTAAGVVKGKLAYMSPEQVGGPNMDRRADIFALGTTLWEVTCDRRLFKADTDAETLRNVREANVPDPRSLVTGYPDALAKVVMRALAADREARYQTAAEMARDLDAFVMAGGRVITPSTLVEIMSKLFPDERDRDASWYEGQGLPIRTVPLAPLVLPSSDLLSEESLPLAAPSVSLAPHDPGAVLTDPSATPIEPSTGTGPAGVPSGLFGMLSSGEIALFVVLSLVVLVAIVTGIVSLSR